MKHRNKPSNIKIEVVTIGLIIFSLLAGFFILAQLTIISFFNASDMLTILNSLPKIGVIFILFCAMVLAVKLGIDLVIFYFLVVRKKSFDEVAHVFTDEVLRQSFFIEIRSNKKVEIGAGMNWKEYKQPIISIGIFLITLIVVKIYLPSSAPIGNRSHKTNDQKIIIIPMAGIPQVFLKKLEEALEIQHKTDVLVTTTMGKGKEMLIPGRDQYNANQLASIGLQIGQGLDRKDAFYILLTNEDINYPDSGLRYVYSSHYEGISVVSLARINGLNFGVLPNLIEVPQTFSTMQKRTLKIINKAIGYGVYGYDVSSNINSVMYGPIMGPKDLDRVGDWY